MPLTLIHSKQILSPHSLTFNTMAAFQFPDPAVQDLVVNPVTGSTYRWKADPGKWVIVAQSTSASDLIWEGPIHLCIHLAIKQTISSGITQRHLSFTSITQTSMAAVLGFQHQSPSRCLMTWITQSLNFVVT